MSTPLGRKTSVEVSLDSTNFVDITKENRSDFTVTTPELERERNDGDGLLVMDLTGHASGQVSFTIDNTAITRTIFALGGGRRMWYRYTPEGKEAGNDYNMYQCLVSVNKTFEPQAAVTYTVTGYIEVAPTEDTH